MASKVHFNLKNVHYAVKNPSGTYGTPVHVPGAVSFTADAVGETTVFWADGIQYFVGHSNNGYEGTLEMALIPESFRVAILRELIDTRGILVEKQNFNTTNFALGFQIDGDNGSTLFWYYNCTASRPAQSAQTNETTKEVQTETLEWSCSPDASGLIRSKTGDGSTMTASTWFGSVYMPLTSIIKTASGAMITLSDAIAEALASMTITRKNLLKYPYYQGTRTSHNITFTDNGDGSINVQGTADADADHATCWRTITDKGQVLPEGTYTVSGCPSGGSSSTYMIFLKTYNSSGTTLNTVYDYGSGSSFTVDSSTAFVSMSIRVKSGTAINTAITFQPQIRLSTDTEGKWIPYTNQPLVYVAEKNLIKYPYASGTTENNGITFTDNGDGSITLNGTASATANFVFLNRNNKDETIYLPAGSYTASGCPTGGSTSTYSIRWGYTTTSGSVSWIGYETGSGMTITVTAGNANLPLHGYISIGSGQSFSNKTFYPMLRLASDTDATWKAYAGEVITAQLDDAGNVANVDDIHTLNGKNNIYTDQSTATISYHSNQL